MKIKKLYAEPEMRLHKLNTSRMIAESINIDNPGYDPNNPKEEEDEGD